MILQLPRDKAARSFPGGSEAIIRERLLVISLLSDVAVSVLLKVLLSVIRYTTPLR